ncbi:MAG TPA: class I SAM-dependent methyltransferase [Candidatus Ozemobacteraceae bacterium]|nr:class I SAM-dependent methyltransferase [Candidatus Ozemobacteraceae bacterium]
MNDAMIRPGAIVSCPLCDRSSGRSLRRCADARLQRCETCGLVYVGARSERPWEVYEQQSASPSAYYTTNALAGRRNASEVLQRICRHVSGGRLLDVGCAGGDFLCVAREAGFAVCGIELNPLSAAHARDHNHLPVLSRRLEEITELSELRDSTSRFGLFSSIHLGDVIEHLPEPRLALLHLRRWLAPGGVLSISTPDFSRPATRLLQIKPQEHLMMFCRTSLTRLLLDCGFSILSLESWDPWRDLAALPHSSTLDVLPVVGRVFRLVLQTLFRRPFPIRLPLRENLLVIARRASPS